MYKLLFANAKGEFFDYPIQPVGRTGEIFVEIMDEDLIPLPESAGLVMLPHCHPIGMNEKGDFVLLKEDPYEEGPAYPVGATLPQGYSRTLLPGYRRASSKPLPLLGYAAVVFKDEQLYVAAVQTDETIKWNPQHYNTKNLGKLIEQRLKKHPQNRILQHLANCSTEYHCFTAQNIFYQRWEGGLPVSPTCNARCLGCISEQAAECCPSPQSRLKFQPTIKEIVEVGADHLEQAEEAIISFGQGCEGEPTMAADTIAEAIKQIRAITARGTININSNAGYTEGIKKTAPGLDSIRVSTISATPEIYKAYYRPKGYNLENVKQSIKICKDHGAFVYLNLLTFPGLTDLPSETEKLLEFIKQTGVDMVQIRNLNIDPDYLVKNLPLPAEEPLGIGEFIETVKQQVPVGNYSKPLR